MFKMPKRRKSLSASPQRNISVTSSASASSSSAVLPLPPAMSNKEEMLCRMCEMFPNLDPSLVEVVLSDYKEVEVVMDYLLELSTAAKGETQLESTGFHKIASFLDGFHVSNQISGCTELLSEQREHPDDICMDGTMCDDLDTLLDETLDRYGLNNVEHPFTTELCENLTSAVNISEIIPEQTTSIQSTQFQTDVERKDCQDALDLYTAPCDYDTGILPTLPSDALETTELLKVETDFSSTPDMIFNFESQIKQQPCTESISTTESSVSLHGVPSESQTKWNPMASSFYPSNPLSSFIAPVAAIPSPWMSVAGAQEPFRGTFYNPQVLPSHVWNGNHFPQTHWSAANINPMNPYKPAARIVTQVSKKVPNVTGKVLILLRGAPGSGKSTVARMLLEQNPAGIILSTDDYFVRNGEYQYDVNCLGEAHEWNHKRAKDAFEKNVSPIIIDNTNLQGWEMKPYVSMAMRYKYKVTFREPDTWWKYKPKELERRNCHGIKKEKIKKMLEHFERVTVNSILNLSRPKAYESADCQITKPADKNRQNSILPSTMNGDETCISNAPVTEPENTLDLDEATVTPKNLEDGLKVPQDVTQLIVENADTDKETYVDFIQATGDISPINEVPHQVDKCSPDSISVEESVVDKPASHINSDSEQLSDRPELQSFVGDWPVEQTIGQRVPRNKKKTKPRLEMYHALVQQANEGEKMTVGCDQLDSEPTEHESLNKTEGNTDFSTVNQEEENIIKLENQLLVALCLMNEENETEEEHKFDGTDVDTDAIVLQEVTQDSGVEEDVKIKGKSDKSNCMHCDSALTFPHSCVTSMNDNKNKHRCESPETIDMVSVDLCKFSQTEPQEFALTWRIEKKSFHIVDSIKVLTGKSNRFKSKSIDASSENIPYRVMHHKSTSVEEDDIVSLDDEDSLNILCKHFRSVSFDFLKDLFERCNKDIVWVTNLLLDSGEKIYKDEECQSEDCYTNENDGSKHLETSKDSLHSNHSTLIGDKSIPLDKHNSLKSYESSLQAPENVTFVNTMPVVVAEEFKNCNVLSSNEVNIPLDYQGQISSQLNKTLSNKDIVTDPIIAHNLWTCDLERRQLNMPKSSVSIVATSNNLPHELHLPSTNKFQRAAGLLHEEQKNTPVETVGDQDKTKNNRCGSQSKESLKFDYLELSLPPEFAFQLTELFGPVGIDPGSLTIEDCVVPIDLKLAESIHTMWKQSIMERHRQEALSYQLQFEGSCRNDCVILDNVLKGQEAAVYGDNLPVSQAGTDMFPFMDQWNTKTMKVSLRKIMSEEMAFQAYEDLKPQSRKNCAIKMKEKQLLELFPQVEKKLLLDIFKENNYSLEKTEEFVSSLLEADPVQNVVAQGAIQAVSSATDKSKEKKVKADKEILSERFFQDLEYPDYDDFRAEAFLYRQKQQESYRKAAEAHHRGMKQVAAFYAQQGYLYGQKMKDENHRAAVQIFERANEYLLPENILDLHGLHVDEAMKHFRKVLQDKTEEFKQNGGKSYLLVITGRGNHSQGGVPRIKPAIADYLTNHDYRFQEKTAGVLRITLK